MAKNKKGKKGGKKVSPPKQRGAPGWAKTFVRDMADDDGICPSITDAGCFMLNSI